MTIKELHYELSVLMSIGFVDEEVKAEGCCGGCYLSINFIEADGYVVLKEQE